MPPAVLLAGAGAGDNITLYLDVDEPTLVVFAALSLSNKVGRGIVIIIAIKVWDGSVDEGPEMKESRGGLGSLEVVSHVLLLLILSLDSKSEDFLLLIELPQVPNSVMVGVKVGGQPPVVLLVGVINESVSMGRLTVEEFDEPRG
jgi:hypothetical protein